MARQTVTTSPKKKTKKWYRVEVFGSCDYWRFRVLNPNNSTLLTSRGYAQKSTAGRAARNFVDKINIGGAVYVENTS